MTFPEALALLKSEHCVTRTDGTWLQFIPVHGDGDHGKLMTMLALFEPVNRTISQYTLTNDDLLADDWQEVDESNSLGGWSHK